MADTSRLNLDLQELAKKLDAWRETRQGRQRIPEELWSEAVRLAAQLGVCKTARALRVDYADLKKRVDALNIQVASTKAEATFVELISPVATNICECAVEVQTSGRAIMRIAMKNVPTLALSSIIRDFVG